MNQLNNNIKILHATIYLLIVSALFTPISLVIYEHVTDKEAGGWTVYWGSIGIFLLFCMGTGDVPSRLDQDKSQNRKSPRIIIALTGLILSLFFLYQSPEYESCNAKILSFEYVKVKDHVRPLITFQCHGKSNSFTKIASISNREKHEPILLRAVEENLNVKASYSHLRGLHGLVIGEHTLKNAQASKLMTNAFSLAVLQASLMMLVLAFTGIRVHHYDLKLGYRSVKKYKKNRNEDLR